jgi:hypothetical protein
LNGVQGVAGSNPAVPIEVSIGTTSVYEVVPFAFLA